MTHQPPSWPALAFAAVFAAACLALVAWILWRWWWTRSERAGIDGILRKRWAIRYGVTLPADTLERLVWDATEDIVGKVGERRRDAWRRADERFREAAGLSVE